MTATLKQIESTFTEWERRYVENPEQFWSEQQKRSKSPESYGEACAPYFLEILTEVQAR